MDTIGRKHWAIAEGYIPSQSSFLDHALISHETACILNAGGSDAHVRAHQHARGAKRGLKICNS